MRPQGVMVSTLDSDCHDFWGERGHSEWGQGCYKHPTLQQGSPTTKNYPAQNVNDAEAEKLWLIRTFSHALVLFTRHLLIQVKVWETPICRGYL